MVFIHLVVAVPHIGQALGRNAFAVVDDLHLHSPILDGLAHQYGPVGPGIVDGVIDEIIQHLGHAQPVGHHHGVAVRFQRDGVAVMQHQLGVPPHNAADHLGEIERLRFGGLRATL